MYACAKEHFQKHWQSKNQILKKWGQEEIPNWSQPKVLSSAPELPSRQTDLATWRKNNELEQNIKSNILMFIFSILYNKLFRPSLEVSALTGFCSFCVKINTCYTSKVMRIWIGLPLLLNFSKLEMFLHLMKYPLLLFTLPIQICPSLLGVCFPLFVCFRIL